jgi:hypothetical protein
MACLYASDYGPPDPHFDPLAAKPHLMAGFESHQAQLARAQNLGQLQAMERALAKGETIAWCDTGYGWTYDQKVDDFFIAIVAFIILPWLVLRVAPGFAERIGVGFVAGKKRTSP